jgi:dolichol-phosphate mannosyltransferase
MATYNEAETIGALLTQLDTYRVIVVDDHSPDGTGALAARFPHVTLISRPGKLGVASAYLEGFRAALALKPRFIVQMDAGGTHRPEDVRWLLNAARLTGVDLVIGARAFKGYGYRSLISRGAAWLMRRLGLSVTDATCGFRCWRAGLLGELDFDAVRSRGFAFQLELLYQAHQAGAGIVQVAIPYRLTNSSFRWGMVREALSVWARLAVRGA